MANKPMINIVGTTCKPEDEERFNKWYNEVHIPMLRKYKGLKGVTRYKIASETPGMATYIAVYNFDSKKDFEAFGKSPEFVAAIQEMQESWPKGIQIAYRAQYDLIQNW